MTREEREDAIDIIQSILNKYEEDECLVTEITIGDGDIEAFKMAIEALEQEPFINKTCVSSEVCEHDKNVVIDKIRAEIETKYGQCDICEYFEDYDYEENDISEYRPIGNIADILQIIDKYKAESEE